MKSKGCGKDTLWCKRHYICGKVEDLKHGDHIILCLKCQAKQLKEKPR